MSGCIYHIASPEAWSAARTAGSYRLDSLEREGFIHCSMQRQILRVANTFYPGRRDLVLLEIDPAALRSELRWEEGTDRPGELFPHVYGPIDLQAVRRVLDFPPSADGQFRSLPL